MLARLDWSSGLSFKTEYAVGVGGECNGNTACICVSSVGYPQENQLTFFEQNPLRVELRLAVEFLHAISTAVQHHRNDGHTKGEKGNSPWDPSEIGRSGALLNCRWCFQQKQRSPLNQMDTGPSNRT